MSDDLQLLVNLHRSNLRQGPGSDEMTRRALTLTGLDRTHPLKIADIGCGTGASTLLLAQELNAELTAVDLFPEFLDELQCRAEAQGVADRITLLQASMEALPFDEEAFDVIWSEGAIYNMGFAAGVKAWRPFLKTGGWLVVTELTWLQSTRPEALQAHWEQEYPEVDTASAKLAQLEQLGFQPEAYFVLPPSCWREGYYGPLQERLESFLEEQGRSDAAQAIVEAEHQEAALYDQYGAYYSYGCYLARKGKD